MILQKALGTLVESRGSVERINMRSESSLVKFISKYANLVFEYLSVYPLLTLQTGDWDLFIDSRVDSTSSTSFKKCIVMLT